jgi:uncharacterized protein (TIGR00369 family)
MRAAPDPDGAGPAADPWADPRTREVTWYDPLALGAAGRSLSGIEFLRAIAEGRLPPPPITSLIGSRLGAVAEGEVEFLWTPHESTYNPQGIVHGGLLCTLLDSASGCAVQTLLPAGMTSSSIEIKVSFLRPLHAELGEVSVVGRALRVGRRIAFAEAHARDGAGELVGQATSSLALVRR